jgi:very-short-patch-repair endonuclease
MRGGPKIIKRAQYLRRNMTEAERALWRELRYTQLGHRFRRQHAIPPYVVDFACVEAKLIVEADGGQHTDSRDQARDQYLERQGWRILRFWNNDIRENRTGVLQVIATALKHEIRPHPNPPPQAGEEIPTHACVDEHVPPVARSSSSKRSF